MPRVQKCLGTEARGLGVGRGTPLRFKLLVLQSVKLLPKSQRIKSSHALKCNGLSEGAPDVPRLKVAEQELNCERDV